MAVTRLYRSACVVGTLVEFPGQPAAAHSAEYASPKNFANRRRAFLMSTLPALSAVLTAAVAVFLATRES